MIRVWLVGGGRDGGRLGVNQTVMQETGRADSSSQISRSWLRLTAGAVMTYH